jgi:hypothetical protein
MDKSQREKHIMKKLQEIMLAGMVIAMLAVSSSASAKALKAAPTFTEVPGNANFTKIKYDVNVNGFDDEADQSANFTKIKYEY